jgi:hypothetical protein
MRDLDFFRQLIYLFERDIEKELESQTDELKKG